LYQVSNPDEIIVHAVSTCHSCQHDLRSVAASAIERRQEFDIPPKRVVVREHQAEQKVCPHCQTVTSASFPQGISAPVQYSPAFGAIAVYLTMQQFLPYERACETIQDLIGPAMTVGTIKNMVQRCADALVPIEEQIKEHLCKGDLLHRDETSLRVMGKRFWGHVACTDRLTFYAVHAKRGNEAVKAIDILPKFTGTCIHDAWATYFMYSNCSHGLCNEHHGRELTYQAEEQKQIWASEMYTLLLDMNTAVKEAKEQGLKRLDPTEVADWKAEVMRPSCKKAIWPILLIPLPLMVRSNGDDANKAPPVICLIDSPSAKMQPCASWKTSLCHLRTIKPNAIFAW
jgi:transposase